MNNLKIEYVPLADLKPNEYNPKGSLLFAEKAFAFDEKYYYRWIWEVELEKEIEG